MDRILSKIQHGEVTFGVWLTIAHPEIAEILSNLPFDWFVIDMEHAPIDVDQIEPILMAMKGTDIVPLARVPWNDPVIIKRVLDLGVEGIIVPWISTPEEAVNAVKAVRYPPEGIRGTGPRRCIRYGFYDIKKYYAEWNIKPRVIAQIETIQGLENVKRIVSVDGIAGTFIGPNDLSASLGIFREFNNPRYVEAIKRILNATLNAKKIAGIMTYTPEDAADKMRMGFNFIALAHDTRYLIEGAKQFFKSVGIPV